MFNLIIFNLVVVSLFSFFTSWFLVKLILFIFRTRSFRFKAFAYMIPIIKLPFDILRANWHNWAIINNVLPWLCKKGSRTLNAFYNIPKSFTQFLHPYLGIKFTTKEQFSFSIADFIYGFVKPYTSYFIVIFLGLYMLCLALKLFRFFKEKKELQKIIINSTPITKDIYNPTLKQLISKHKISLLQNTQYSDSPFVTGYKKPKIIFPQKLHNYTQEEFEAILAHEINHLKNKDLIFKIFLNWICFIFAWIPTKKLLKHISCNQELLCDIQTLRFNINKTDLATAIQKQVQIQYQKQTCSSQLYFTGSTKTTYRISVLDQDVKKHLKSFQFFLMIVSTYVLFGILLGRFWMI